MPRSAKRSRTSLHESEYLQYLPTAQRITSGGNLRCLHGPLCMMISQAMNLLQISKRNIINATDPIVTTFSNCLFSILMFKPSLQLKADLSNTLINACVVRVFRVHTPCGESVVWMTRRKLDGIGLFEDIGCDAAKLCRRC